MGERVLVFAIAAAAAAAVVARDWKSTPKKARLVIVLVFLYACYTGYGYISDRRLPNLPSAADAVFGPLAKRVDTFLKPQAPKTPTSHEGDGTNE